MDITGKIIQILSPRTGTSARTGNTWKSQEYVIETHAQYPKKCCFRVFGEERINSFNIQLGEELTVSIDIEAREYNGSWYNDINAWRVTRLQQPAQQQPQYQAAPAPAPATPAPAPAQAQEEELPF